MDAQRRLVRVVVPAAFALRYSTQTEVLLGPEGSGGRVGRRRVFQVTEQVAVCGENQSAVVAEGFTVGVHRAEESVELRRRRAAAIGARKNLRGPRVGLAADFLDFAIGLGFDSAQVAFLGADYFCRLALALGAEARRDLLALADHPFVNLRADLRVVVDAHKPHGDQFDPEIPELRRGQFHYFTLNGGAAQRNREQHVALAGVRIELRVGDGFPVLGGADNLDQVVLGHSVADLAADDVVEAGERASLITQSGEELQRVADAPAAERVHDYVELVARGHLTGAAVPFENAFVDAVDRLNEGQLGMHSGV